MSHKTNGGLSDARNAGVEICHGEYIVFVDSDDYVDTEFIQKMYQSLVDSSSDVAMCSVIWEDENGKPLLNSPAAAFARDVVSGRACMELTYSNPNAVTAWNKLYHRSLWNDLRFPKGKLHEDEFVFHEIMYQCDRVATLPDKLDHYVQHQGSIMHAKYNIRYLDRTDAWIQRLQSFLCLQVLGHREIRVLPHLHPVCRLHSSGCRGLLGNQTRVRAGHQWLGLADCDVLPLCAGHDALGCAAIAGKEGAFHISGYAEEEAAHRLTLRFNVERHRFARCLSTCV